MKRLIPRLMALCLMRGALSIADAASGPVSGDCGQGG